MTIKTDVQEFWDLMGGAADFYMIFRHQNLRTIKIGDARHFVDIPLPVEYTYAFSPYPEFPMAPEFPVEQISLKKWAWQWQVNGERRIYTARIGRGTRSNVIAYNNPHVYVDPRHWGRDRDPSIEERLYYNNSRKV
jgi:hypothetical protein